MTHETLMWIVFWVLVFGMLALDLLVFNRRAHEVRLREALFWSAFWIGLSLLFAVGVHFELGPEAAVEFLTAYLVEKSLSMDNLFVFLMLFTYFGVAPRYQHKVLFWGILSALAIRAVFIMTGVTLLARFHWVIYLFGVFLIYTGVKMAWQKDVEVHPERNPLLRLVRRLIPVTREFHEDHFFIKQLGKWVATPLLVVLLVVETTDIIFAVDSVPAVLAISIDPFIVYTSNVFAILGLRALYFALAGIMRMFHHLHYGLSTILVFVGAKMLLADVYKIPSSTALLVVALLLVLSVVASILFPEEKKKAPSGDSY